MRRAISGKAKICAAIFSVCVLGLYVTGCMKTVPVSTTPVAMIQPSDVQSGASLVGSLGKAFVPMAGAPGVAAVTAITDICNLKSGAPTMSTLQTALEAVWTKFDSLNTAQSKEVVLAVNALWTMFQSQVSKIQAVTAQAPYVEAAIDGICQGFTGP